MLELIRKERAQRGQKGNGQKGNLLGRNVMCRKVSTVGSRHRKKSGLTQVELGGATMEKCSMGRSHRTWGTGQES